MRKKNYFVLFFPIHALRCVTDVDPNPIPLDYMNIGYICVLLRNKCCCVTGVDA